MEIIYCSNEFPRDDLEALLRRLHNHSKDRHHPLLSQFITEATRAIRDEVRRLPKTLQELIPPFASVLEWASNTTLREGVLCGSIDGVLLVCVQLATYIGYVVEAYCASEMLTYFQLCRDSPRRTLQLSRYLPDRPWYWPPIVNCYCIFTYLG